MNNIISMKNVRKEFHVKQSNKQASHKQVAISNLSLQIQEGEIFGFLGPSGAGKTTSIKLLTSQLKPTSGEITVFGKEVFSNKKYLFEHIGILSDNSGLYDRLSVYDNLMLFAKIKNVPINRVNEILEKVELSDYMNKEAGKLSKGMKQRLLIARAVIHKPKLLFLDEPTSSLDPGTSLEIHDLLRQLNKEGTTIFLTTHNMEEADKLCHRVAFLNQGEIVEMGNPEELKLKYITDDIKVVLKGSKKLLIKNNPESGKQIKAWMENNQLLSIKSVEPNLETIFLNLTGRGL
jgi:ABC-2 type transport system ATP-binding protein